MLGSLLVTLARYRLSRLQVIGVAAAVVGVVLAASFVAQTSVLGFEAGVGGEFGFEMGNISTNEEGTTKTGPDSD